MNKRIQDLAEHCDFYVGNEHYNESHEEKQRLWTEKFAELIVKECSVIADQHNESKLSEDYNLGVGRAIKRYFGVE